MIDKTKFRNASGTRLYKAIFHEMVFGDKPYAQYTLKDYDHEYNGNKYLSLYKLYMDMEDLTEYEFANTYLDGWEHWENLCECDWFKPYAARWRKELDLKIKARALKSIKVKALEDGRDGIDAMKYLLERKWEPKPVGKSGAGRPSKDEIKAKAQDLFDNELEILADRKRLTN